MQCHCVPDSVSLDGGPVVLAYETLGGVSPVDLERPGWGLERLQETEIVQRRCGEGHIRLELQTAAL
jgi:hypothetical protein